MDPSTLHDWLTDPGSGADSGAGDADLAYLTVEAMQALSHFSLSADASGGGGGGAASASGGGGGSGAGPSRTASTEGWMAGSGGGGGGGAPPPLPSTDRLRGVVAAQASAGVNAHWEWEDNPVGSDVWCSFHQLVSAKLEEQFK